MDLSQKEQQNVFFNFNPFQNVWCEFTIANNNHRDRFLAQLTNEIIPSQSKLLFELAECRQATVELKDGLLTAS